MRIKKDDKARHWISLGFLLVAVFFLAGKPLADGHDWQLRVRRGGISVYTRPVDASPLLEFRADVELAFPLDKVLALFEDADKVPLWYHQCVLKERMVDEGADSGIYYFVLRLPWPVAARDVVFRQARSRDPATGAVSYAMSALPEERPPVKGRVRVTYLKTAWHFTPLDSGRTRVDFIQHSDAGGSLPAFLANALVVDIPFNSLKRFRALLSGALTDPRG
jgi:hypothetical protein